MVWDATAPFQTPSPDGLLNRMIWSPVVTVQANGNGAGVTLTGHSTAVVIDGTATQFKDATGQYQNITGDFNRNGWRQQTEVDPQTGLQFTARMKSPAALPAAAGVGRWVYGIVDSGFEDANPATVQGLAFRFDRTVGDTNWMAVCRGPVGETEIDTLVPFAVNTRYDFAILMVTGAATFVLNDQRVAQFTSDLPASLLRLYGVTRSNGASGDVTTRNAFLQVIWGCND